jgi:hypothetical protein
VYPFIFTIIWACPPHFIALHSNQSMILPFCFFLECLFLINLLLLVANWRWIWLFQDECLLLEALTSLEGSSKPGNDKLPSMKVDWAQIHYLRSTIKSFSHHQLMSNFLLRLHLSISMSEMQWQASEGSYLHQKKTLHFNSKHFVDTPMIDLTRQSSFSKVIW